MSEMKNLKYVIGPYKVRPSTLHSYTLHTHTQGSFFGDIVLYLGNGLIIRYKYLIIPESQHTHNSHIILPGLPDYTYLIRPVITSVQNENIRAWGLPINKMR